MLQTVRILDGIVLAQQVVYIAPELTNQGKQRFCSLLILCPERKLLQRLHHRLPIFEIKHIALIEIRCKELS